LDFDDFCLQASKFVLSGAELFIIRGGEITGLISDTEEPLEFLKTLAPVRVHSSGIRTPAVERLKRVCDGFCIDVKFPLKGSFDSQEKEHFALLLPGSSCPYSYRDSLKGTLETVKGMPHSYLTSSTFNLLLPVQQEQLLQSLDSFGLPILIGHHWYKKVQALAV